MIESMKLPIVAAGLAAAFLTMSAPAMAETPFSTGTVTVRYSGADLSTQAGRHALGRRVDGAISSMCGQPVFGTRDEADALRLCRTEARTAAEPQIRTAFANANPLVASSR